MLIWELTGSCCMHNNLKKNTTTAACSNVFCATPQALICQNDNILSRGSNEVFPTRPGAGDDDILARHLASRPDIVC